MFHSDFLSSKNGWNWAFPTRKRPNEPMPSTQSCPGRMTECDPCFFGAKGTVVANHRFMGYKTGQDCGPDPPFLSSWIFSRIKLQLLLHPRIDHISHGVDPTHEPTHFGIIIWSIVWSKKRWSDISISRHLGISPNPPIPKCPAGRMLQPASERGLALAEKPWPQWAMSPQLDHGFKKSLKCSYSTNHNQCFVSQLQISKCWRYVFPQLVHDRSSWWFADGIISGCVWKLGIAPQIAILIGQYRNHHRM